MSSGKNFVIVRPVHPEVTPRNWTVTESYHDLRDIEGVEVVISSNHTVRKHLISSLCGSKPLGLSSSITSQSDESRDTPRNIRDQHMGLKSSTP